MPNSVTIARAMSVARCRSFCAPVETSPNAISSALAPAEQDGQLPLQIRAASSGSDPRAAAASCSRARRSRAPTIEILCTGSRSGSMLATIAWPDSWYATMLPLLVAHDALLLEARDDAIDRLVEVLHARRLVLSSPRREQRRLVDQVRQIGAGESRRPLPRSTCRSTFSGDLHRLHVDPEDVLASLDVGLVDQHLAVEASRSGAGQDRAPRDGWSPP